MNLLGVRAANCAARLSRTGHIRRGMTGLQRRNGIPPHKHGDRNARQTHDEHSISYQPAH
jgi:hypothetical protein